MNKTDWITNIENLADIVAERFGTRTVSSVYSKYGARGVASLSPSCYSNVFADFQYLTADI